MHMSPIYAYGTIELIINKVSLFKQETHQEMR